MLHAIVDLLDNSTYHTDSCMAYIGSWRVAQQALILQVTCARKGFGHARLDSLCIYTVEHSEFLDIPIHIHVHVVTMHKYKTIMTVLIASV